MLSQLWDTQQNLKQLFQAAPIAMITTNQAGEILFANPRLEAMFGYTAAELVGQPIEILIPQTFRQNHTVHRAADNQTPRVRVMDSGLDLGALHKDGSQFLVEVGLSFVDLVDQRLILASITDLTLHKQAEQQLEQKVEERTHELERRQLVSDGLRDILTMLNSNRPRKEVLDYIVNQTSQLLQAKACAIYRLQDDNRTLIIQNSKGLSARYIAQAAISMGQGTTGQAASTGRPSMLTDVEAVLTHSTPETLPRRQALQMAGYGAVLAVPLLVQETVYGSLSLYYPTAHQFSEEEIELAVMVSDQAALAIENDRLRTQLEEAAVAAERNRLARDLHDSVTQTLFSASLIAEVLPKLVKRNPAEAERRLDELRQLTRGALAEMRTLLLELRPARLTEISLGDLLRQLAEATTGRAKIPVQVTADSTCPLPPDVQVALYRIAQEALNNVAKHAQASRVTVALHCQPQYVKLSIGDNGRGFDLSKIKPNSLGLSIMHERAESIAAQLTITNQPKKGTLVGVVWQ